MSLVFTNSQQLEDIILSGRQLSYEISFHLKDVLFLFLTCRKMYVVFHLKKSVLLSGIICILHTDRILILRQKLTEYQ